MKQDKEKLIKYKMYLINENIKQEKKQLKILRQELNKYYEQKGMSLTKKKR